MPGGARTEGTEGSCWTLCSGGTGFQLITDGGQFLYQEIEGDFILTTEVEDLRNAGPLSQAGLMARESSEASDPAARQGSLLLQESGNLIAMRRPQEGHVATLKTSGAGDRWLRVERKGGAILGSHSPDGTQWTPLEAPLLERIVASKVFVGLAASPRLPATQRSYAAMEARFCGVRLERAPSGTTFRRGDTNDDGKADLSDAVAALGFLFLGTPQKLACDKSADVNDDGNLDLTDPIGLLDHLFLGAPAPPAPFGQCGLDPIEDALTCEAPGQCP